MPHLVITMQCRPVAIKQEMFDIYVWLPKGGKRQLDKAKLEKEPIYMRGASEAEPRGFSISVWGGLLMVHGWFTALLHAQNRSFLRWNFLLRKHRLPQVILQRGRLKRAASQQNDQAAGCFPTAEIRRSTICSICDNLTNWPAGTWFHKFACILKLFHTDFLRTAAARILSQCFSVHLTRPAPFDTSLHVRLQPSMHTSFIRCDEHFCDYVSVPLFTSNCTKLQRFQSFWDVQRARNELLTKSMLEPE